jgi:hypothetical protein
MALSSAHDIARVNSDPIVPHMRRQVLALCQVDAQTTSVGMGFCILDSFVSDSIQLVANVRMQLSFNPNDRNRHRHSVRDNSSFGSSLRFRFRVGPVAPQS